MSDRAGADGSLASPTGRRKGRHSVAFVAATQNTRSTPLSLSQLDSPGSSPSPRSAAPFPSAPRDSSDTSFAEKSRRSQSMGPGDRKYPPGRDLSPHQEDGGQQQLPLLGGRYGSADSTFSGSGLAPLPSDSAQYASRPVDLRLASPSATSAASTEPSPSSAANRYSSTSGNGFRNGNDSGAVAADRRIDGKAGAAAGNGIRPAPRGILMNGTEASSSAAVSRPSAAAPIHDLPELRPPSPPGQTIFSSIGAELPHPPETALPAPQPDPSSRLSTFGVHKPIAGSAGHSSRTASFDLSRRDGPTPAVAVASGATSGLASAGSQWDPAKYSSVYGGRPAKSPSGASSPSQSASVIRSFPTAAAGTTTLSSSLSSSFASIINRPSGTQFADAGGQGDARSWAEPRSARVVGPGAGSSISNPFAVAGSATWRASVALAEQKRLRTQTPGVAATVSLHDRIAKDLQFLWESASDVPGRPKKPLAALAELIAAQEAHIEALKTGRPLFPLTGSTNYSFSEGAGSHVTVRPTLSNEKIREPVEPSFFECLLAAMEMRGIALPKPPALPKKPLAMSEARYAELVLEHCGSLPTD